MDQSVQQSEINTSNSSEVFNNTEEEIILDYNNSELFDKTDTSIQDILNLNVEFEDNIEETNNSMRNDNNQSNEKSPQETKEEDQEMCDHKNTKINDLNKEDNNKELKARSRQRNKRYHNYYQHFTLKEKEKSSKGTNILWRRHMY